VAQISKHLLHRLDVDEVGPCGLKSDIAGIKYLFIRVLDQPEKAARVPWPRVPLNLPEVLSIAEIELLFANITDIQHRYPFTGVGPFRSMRHIHLPIFNENLTRSFPLNLACA
jgi:hypothetical protein